MRDVTPPSTRGRMAARTQPCAESEPGIDPVDSLARAALADAKADTMVAAIADAIADAVGGLSNLASVSACMTRLRLRFIDSSRVDMEKLARIKNSAGLIRRGHECQLVFGLKASVYRDALRAAMAVNPTAAPPAHSI